MSDRQTVVYSARTSQDAHLLKNLLIDAQIWAAVTNDLLERGSGVDVVGWSTAAQVVVREEDGPRAREIALEFDRGAAPRGAQDVAEESPDAPDAADPALDDWPRCPTCGARRLTRCPICGTAGSAFAQADMGFDWVPEAGDPLAAGSCGGKPACGCGSVGCSTSAGREPPVDDDEEGEPPEQGLPVALRTCPTCDEPFVPRYAHRCEWCGHEFGDGEKVELPGALPEPLSAQLNRRVIAVIVGLAVLGAALAIYFLALATS